jgi:hypothetical protein
MRDCCPTGRAGVVDSACLRLIAPVSDMVWSTSFERSCAALRLCVGARRDGAWTIPASIADWASVSCSGSRSK